MSISTEARSVAAALAESATDVQKQISEHPWVQTFADGSLPDQAFVNWAGQCAWFCRMERPALLRLRSYIQPGRLDDLLTQLVADTVREPLELADTLNGLGEQIPDQPWPISLGYGSYVEARASDGLLQGLVAVLAAERVYLDTWTALEPSCPAGSRYRQWVENWSCSQFREVVTGLGDCLDELAGPPSATLLEELQPIYRTMLLWELDFWEMSWRGYGWLAAGSRP
jgi:thiaminase